jgi:hypothetical protein
MKTVKLIAFAIFLFAISNSCIEENPEKWHAEILEVKARDWELVGNSDEIGSYYQYVFDKIPYVDGIINVYLYQNFGTPAEIQVPLPYTYYGVDVLDNGEEKYYSIQYSYDTAIDGTIALKIHVSDYMTSLFKRDTEYFRIAIIY